MVEMMCHSLRAGHSVHRILAGPHNDFYGRHGNGRHLSLPLWYLIERSFVHPHCIVLALAVGHNSFAAARCFSALLGTGYGLTGLVASSPSVGLVQGAVKP